MEQSSGAVASRQARVAASWRDILAFGTVTIGVARWSPLPLSHLHALALYFPSIASSLPPTHHIPSPIMSEGRLKADRDFTKEVDKAVPEAQDLAKVAMSCVQNTRRSG
jgi:hypothetical protein